MTLDYLQIGLDPAGSGSLVATPQTVVRLRHLSVRQSPWTREMREIEEVISDAKQSHVDPMVIRRLESERGALDLWEYRFDDLIVTDITIGVHRQIAGAFPAGCFAHPYTPLMIVTVPGVHVSIHVQNTSKHANQYRISWLCDYPSV